MIGAFLLTLLAGFSAAAPLRGPYLVDASSTAVRICWRAEKDECAAWNDLVPDAQFQYTIAASTRRWTARPLPMAGEALRFAAFGDSGSGRAAQQAVAATLEAYAPQFVLLAGDLVYPRGADQGYDARYFEPYAPLLSRIPFFPSPGNHDYANAGANREKGESRFRSAYAKIHRRPRYYAFTVGDARFFSLDTNAPYGVAAAAPIAKGSPQWRWLEKELAASPELWKIALFHVPAYSSGKHGGDERVRAALEPLFSKYGVDLAIQGHDHHYERTAKIKKTVYAVVGTGGAGLRGLKWRDRAEWSEFALVEHGFLGVELRGGSLKSEFYDERAQIRDFAEITKAPRKDLRPRKSRSP